VAGAGGMVPVAMTGIGISQAGFVIYASASLALVQALSPARLRGRLTSLFTLLYWGLMPIGALFEGMAAQQTNSLVTLVGMGIVMLAAGALAFLARPQVASLRLARDGNTITGRLDGSGYGSDRTAAA
jgi:hypothetical protein